MLRTCVKCKSSGSNRKFAFIIPTLDRTHTHTRQTQPCHSMPQHAAPPVACLLAAYPAAFVRLIKQISVFNDSFPGPVIAFELPHTQLSCLSAYTLFKAHTPAMAAHALHLIFIKLAGNFSNLKRTRIHTRIRIRICVVVGFAIAKVHTAYTHAHTHTRTPSHTYKGWQTYVWVQLPFTIWRCQAQ